MTDEFDKFIEEKTKKTESSFDPEKEKKEWFDYIDEFYNMLWTSLDKYRDSGKIIIEHYDVEISEEYLGTYTAKGLRLQVGNDVIKFIPIGTFLIGTKGRIDLEGPSKSFSFILVDKNSKGPNIQVKMYTSEEEKRKDEENEKSKPIVTPDWTWKLLKIDHDVEFVDLNNEIFLKCIMETVNG